MRSAGLYFLMFGAAGFAANPVTSVHFNGGEQGRIQIEVKVNNQGPFPFIFDTGSMNIVSLDLANQLGVKVAGHRTMQGFGGPVENASAVLDSISLGGSTMQRSKVAVIGGGPFSKGGLAGILGREFLAKLVAEVDYEHGTLKFFDPATFAYAGRGARLSVTVRQDGLVTIPVEIFGAAADIQVDSGSEKPLVLFPRFVQAHDFHSKLEAITGYGFGGLTRAMITRAPVLAIDNLEIKNLIVHLSLDKSGIESGPADGNVGGPVLREFTCVYDLPHHCLYLEPNAWYGKPELADKSGLVLDTRGSFAKVLFVYPGSPAANAGIVRGDNLKDSNGRELTGEEWHDLLDGEPGSIVRATVKHQGHVANVSFALRRYF
jgi:aspartyl protease